MQRLQNHRLLRLGELTRTEATSRALSGATCLLPVGSLEQHGDHLPLSTDSLLAEAICLRSASLARSDVVVAPVLWAGFSPHHLRFGATVTLTQETMLALVREVTDSLRALFRLVLIINGHGGNRGLLSSLMLELGVHVHSYWDLISPNYARELFPIDRGSIGHAGQVETSLMLATNPDLVREPGDRFEPYLEGDALYNPDLGSSGVIGDPRMASETSGAAYLHSCSQALADLIDSLVTQDRGGVGR